MRIKVAYRECEEEARKDAVRIAQETRFSCFVYQRPTDDKFYASLQGDDYCGYVGSMKIYSNVIDLIHPQKTVLT